MNALTKAAVQGAACGLMIGVVLLVGACMSRPQAAATQPKEADVSGVVRARSLEIVDAGGKVRLHLGEQPDGHLGYSCRTLRGIRGRVYTCNVTGWLAYTYGTRRVRIGPVWACSQMDRRA